MTIENVAQDRDSTFSEASAGGKVILVGEHAVVYGAPAIAIPVSNLRATARVTNLLPGQGVVIEATDLGTEFSLEEAASPEALALQTTVRNALVYLTGNTDHDVRIEVRSKIPLARGMGSGTAVATAIVRALARHFIRQPSPAEISALVFETERLLHGTPSGVDNTVVAHERPVYFVKGRPPEFIRIGGALNFLIADTGTMARTRDAVLDVQRRWRLERARYEGIFSRIGKLVEEAREALAGGDAERLGCLMNENHDLLQEIQVSSPSLDHLVSVARDAGAVGAKLTGGGYGGVILALAREERPEVAETLLQNGALAVYSTTLQPSKVAPRLEGRGG